jgi:hypothetical protein
VEGSGDDLIGCTLLVETLPPEPACSEDIRKEMGGREVMKLRKNKVKIKETKTIRL